MNYYARKNSRGGGDGGMGTGGWGGGEDTSGVIAYLDREKSAEGNNQHDDTGQYIRVPGEGSR